MMKLNQNIMRAILFFILVVVLPASVFATPPTAEDEAIFRQCVEGYLANLESFTVVDVRFRFASVNTDRFEELSKGDFSSVIWTGEFRQYDHLDRQRCEFDNPDTENGVVIFTPDGVLNNGQSAFFTLNSFILKQKEASSIDVELSGREPLSQILISCLNGHTDWSRTQKDNKNPTFAISTNQIVEFDPSRGFLAVCYRLESMRESDEKYWKELRIIEAKRFGENRWFPTKTLTKYLPSECHVSEIIDIQVDKPYRSTDFELTLPAGCEFAIEDDDITLTHPLTIRVEDYPRLPQLALKYKFNQLLFSNPRELPRFLYNKPQALWFLAPYLLLPALPVLALIAFRLYRGKSTGKA